MTELSGADPDPAQMIPSGALERYRKDVLVYVPATIVPAIVSIVSVAIFTRVFTTGEYGLYAFVMAACTLVGGILFEWIKQSTGRFRPRFQVEGAIPSFDMHLLRLFLVFGGFVLGLAVAGWVLFTGSSSPYLPFYWIAVLLILVTQAWETCSIVVRADLRAGSYALFAIAQSLLRLGLAVVFVFLIYRNVVSLVAALALSYFLLLPALISVARAPGRDISKVQRVTRPLPFQEFARLFADYGIPMVGFSIGALLLGVSDRLVIEIFRGPEEVGIYTANYTIVSSAVGLAAAPLLSAAFPIILKAAQDPHRLSSETESLISRLSGYYLILAGLLVTVVGTLRVPLTQLVLGPTFRSGSDVIPFVLAGYLFWHLGTYAHKGLEVSSRTKVLLAVALGCASTNLILNLTFVPRFGYMAAAVTTCLSYLLYPVVIWVIPNRVRWRLSVRLVLNVVAASTITFIAAGISLRVVDRPFLQLALGTTIGCAAYMAALVALGQVSLGELRRLSRAIASGLMVRGGDHE